MVNVVKTSGMPADIMMVSKSYHREKKNSFFPYGKYTHVCPKYPPLHIYNKSYTSTILVSSLIYFV